jgi:hypothetical protein
VGEGAGADLRREVLDSFGDEVLAMDLHHQTEGGGKRSRWTVRADYHRLALSRRQDLWYQGGGAFQNGPAFGYVGRPSGGETGLANLFDLSVDYVISPKSSVTFYAAHAAGRGVIERIYPGGKDASLFYLELNQKL